MKLFKFYSIIFRKSDFKIVCWPFNKFFNHGDENILELRSSIEIADIVFDAYSDVFKEKNGFRPRNPITVKECVENLKDYIEG